MNKPTRSIMLLTHGGDLGRIYAAQIQAELAEACSAHKLSAIQHGRRSGVLILRQARLKRGDGSRMQWGRVRYR